MPPAPQCRARSRSSMSLPSPAPAPGSLRRGLSLTRNRPDPKLWFGAGERPGSGGSLLLLDPLLERRLQPSAPLTQIPAPEPELSQSPGELQAQLVLSPLERPGES